MTEGTTPPAGHPLVAPPSDAFRFGRNWQRYLSEHFDPGREQIAAESLIELVGDLRGKSFLDVGCGSGLFSLCAHKAGAASVLSLDVDPDSVAATRSLHEQAGAPSNWRVMHRSILDADLLAELEPADVVYSWGVLHHTGAMYEAIGNAARLVAPGGLFAIAIYNRVVARWLDSDRWLQIKRTYNHVPRIAQRAMEAAYGAYWLLACLRNRENPVRVARDYRESRGMALWTDMLDWLGGYPYEFATVDEIVSYCEQRCGLRSLKTLPLTSRDTGNNQFVFIRLDSTEAPLP
jgi:SAM-dependent methyltransferase